MGNFRGGLIFVDFVDGLQNAQILKVVAFYLI